MKKACHLIMDLYECDRQEIEDLMHIYNFLDCLPSNLEMIKMIPPYVFRYSGVATEDRGISGFVLIGAGHISINTFPEKEYVSIDVFSRKSFDADIAEVLICEFFKNERVETKLVKRG